jgi:branched-chain amino acid aminotransferase
MIYTPALEEGCVSGVMRRHLIAAMKNSDYQIKEEAISVNDIKNADEVFLTNAINGIRWAKQFRDKVYTNQKTAEIYNLFIKTIVI